MAMVSRFVMRFAHLLSSACIAVVALLLLSVSVHPAMAAEVVNEQLGGCTGCGPGLDDLSSLPVFEGKKVPTITISEISPTGNNVAATAATVAGTQRMRINSAVTLDIRDPFSGNIASATALTDAEAGTATPEIAAVIANMSRDGYDMTGESSHRYKSIVTSDDFLALNSSQKTALATGGFTLTASDTGQSYRDVSYYTFTNRTTQAHVYLMAIQQLDTRGNPIGNQNLALSPEFSASGARVAASSIGTSSSGSDYCIIEWIAVILAAIGLVVNIVAIIVGTDGVYAPIIFDAVAVLTNTILFKIASIHADGRVMADRFWAARPYVIAVAVITCLILLIVLIYSIYKLGICMGWWSPVDEEKLVWSYQYRLTDADNGKVLPLALHDRFALALFADTRVDKDAHWIVVSHPGLIARDELSAATENGTIQSWLVEATEAGSQEFTLKYMTTQPVPPTVIAPEYTLKLSVAPGQWKIATIDTTGEGSGDGAYPSLLIDRSGTSRISYYNTNPGQVMYGERIGTCWTVESVASSDGTYSTSLALDRSGNPAISFGDGLYYGNMMYAQKNGTQWEVSKIDGGTAGDAGHYSSLAFDTSGLPRITYNDGQHYASLKYAILNDSTWEISKVDTDGLTGDTGYMSSFAIDNAGHSHITYTNGKYFADLMYATDETGSWAITRVDDGGGRMSSTGFDPSLALDSKGLPHISYYDNSDHDLRYASWNGTMWNLETVDSVNDVGRHPSLAIDAKDIPHISYYDNSNKELRYATYAFGQWVIRTVDTDGDVGDYSSLALDAAGHPCIAYYDATNHALKYAGWTG